MAGGVSLLVGEMLQMHEVTACKVYARVNSKSANWHIMPYFGQYLVDFYEFLCQDGLVRICLILKA